jgi:hypothetical protein
MYPGDRTVAHLHTKFLFPFSIDVEEVRAGNPAIWPSKRRWIEGLDELVCSSPGRSDGAVVRHIGGWTRLTHSRFDLESPNYQNLVFFHPFVRRVFFDLPGQPPTPGRDSLVRSYQLPIPPDSRLWYHVQDMSGESAEAQVESISLALFANGIGILTIGTEAFDIPASRALWINEMMRKVYASSGRQVRECRAPSCSAFILDRGGERQTVVEHDYRNGELVNLLPPLARTITSLLPFLDYSTEDYEPVLDERMVVYSYVSLAPEGLPADYLESEEYQVLLSRLLYVDQAGPDFRYDPQYTREAMERQLYRRWSHLGTYYGFTPYSSVTVTIGSGGSDADGPREGLLIHRMFDTRYYIMATIALFYRATLLDFSERVALVSKHLYFDQWYGRSHLDNIQLVGTIRAEFLHFNTHWYFDELTNKDEEREHFEMQCQQYRTEVMRHDIERELDALNDSLMYFHQFRATEAVNRLAIISLMLGCGAVATGFYGMNFGHVFDFLLKPAPGREWMFWLGLGFAGLIAFGALWIGIWMIFSNWTDYRNAVIPKKIREGWTAAGRMRKSSG